MTPCHLSAKQHSHRLSPLMAMKANSDKFISPKPCASRKNSRHDLFTPLSTSKDITLLPEQLKWWPSVTPDRKAPHTVLPQFKFSPACWAGEHRDKALACLLVVAPAMVLKIWEAVLRAVKIGHIGLWDRKISREGNFLGITFPLICSFTSENFCTSNSTW